MTDATESEAERYLDLAGFADGLLDPDEHERVAERLAGDPVAAGDVAAARSLAGVAGTLPAVSEPVILRAGALVGGRMPAHSTVVPFPARRREPQRLRHLASWGSLAAAMAVASWLGFTLGVDTSRSLTQVGQTTEGGFLQELLDPSTGFTRDPTGGNRT